ncbi:MAG: hypothetical protein FWH04_01475 [Oscillospiraceae bacterium]|nr:hypothetical protein [Oscillospiraceae bacterium]
MKKNKILWIVIVGLMVFELTLGSGHAAIIWLTFISFLLPIVTCSLIAITKRYEIMWITVIPSIVEIIYVSITEMRPHDLTFLPMPKIISTFIIVAVAYLLVLDSKKSKQKNKKKEDD